MPYRNLQSRSQDSSHHPAHDEHKYPHVIQFSFDAGNPFTQDTNGAGNPKLHGVHLFEQSGFELLDLFAAHFLFFFPAFLFPIPSRWCLWEQ
jgi:hypothetical protein